MRDSEYYFEEQEVKNVKRKEGKYNKINSKILMTK